MQWRQGEYWLRDAVKYIKFPPDRRRVRQELYEHMIARNRDFLAEGYSEAEADRLSCEAMGDSAEVGKALAAVHRPFWGYFVRALRILTALVLVFGVLNLVMNRNTDLGGYASAFSAYDGRTEKWISQEAEARCGDYRLRLRRAGLTAPGPAYEGDPAAGMMLTMELRAATWDPLLGPPRFYYGSLTVEDSLGQTYTALVHFSRDLVFFSDTLVLVEHFDPSAEWAVLSYEAGGRGFRLPVRLEGGER